jgi:hypothetical protein
MGDADPEAKVVTKIAPCLNHSAGSPLLKQRVATAILEVGAALALR